jgi:cGMP-dependent protein kinase 1
MGCVASKHKKSSALQATKPVSTSILLPSKHVRKIRPADRKLNSSHHYLSNSLLKISLDNFELTFADRIIREKTRPEKSEICKTLQNHFLFQSLPVKDVNFLVQEFAFYRFPEQALVFSQYSTGLYFYLIAAGSVSVEINGQIKAVLGKGECFGDLALLHDTLRTATVQTIEATDVWVLDRDTFKRAVKSISKHRFQENKAFLDSIPIFATLSGVQKVTLLELMVSQEFKAGEKVVCEGDMGEIFYIVKKGNAMCSVRGVEVREIGPGDVFGEQALLYGTKRTATITALSKLSLLSLGSSQLAEVFGGYFQSIIYRNSQLIAMERSKIFSLFTKSQKSACLDLMKIVSFETGKIVFKKGDILGDKVFFIVKGRLSCEMKTAEVFDCIGDVELKENPKQFIKKWRAVEDTDIAVLTRVDLEKCIGGNVADVIRDNELLRILREVHIFRPLPEDRLKTLGKLMNLIEIPAGNTIFKQGDHGDSLFIVKEGQVDVIKDGTIIRTISKDDYFGERSIILNETRTATTIAKTDTICWVLSSKNFLSLIDDHITDLLIHRIQLQNDSVSIKNLKFLKNLGEGMFGQVHLVRDFSNNQLYALKIVERWKISKFNLYENVVQERRILLQLDHPMAMRLVCTFKDAEKVYFLCEYVEGAELFDVMRQLGAINEEKAAFYIGCILLVLRYLHERSIIYRDLKPENIIVDKLGYPVLIDFGTAKLISERTYTVMGTPHYMAPEVVKGTGYGLEADLWSVGIMLFEFLFYNVPFAAEESDTYKIYQKIQTENLVFPGYAEDCSCLELIRKLLHKKPAMRGTCESVMKNQWFTGMNWDKLLSKHIVAPFLPIYDKEGKRKEGEMIEIALKDGQDKKREGLSNEEGFQAPKDWDLEF